MLGLHPNSWNVFFFVHSSFLYSFVRSQAIINNTFSVDKEFVNKLINYLESKLKIELIISSNKYSPSLTAVPNC